MYVCVYIYIHMYMDTHTHTHTRDFFFRTFPDIFRSNMDIPHVSPDDEEG